VYRLRACEPVCPVKAIFTEDETTEQWQPVIALNRQFFVDNPGIQPTTTKN
jgi:formate hydrogenlyase subunit 6/NADH:ubiquinone oxidoreductase subunit I